MHAPTAHTAHRRVIAFAMLVAFGCLQMASGYHAATERHAVCPEHGEIVHVYAAPEQEMGALASAPEKSAKPIAHAVAPPESSGEHEHDHCYLCPSSRPRACLSSAETFSAPTRRAHPVLAVAAVYAPIAAQRYLVAPKQSPPV